MAAALTSQLTYYSDPRGYSLKAAVAKAGGVKAHVDLFNFLLTASVKGCLKNTQNSDLTFHDCRAGNSLLLLFPPNLQLVLSLAFYLQEIKLVEDFSNSYSLKVSIKRPEAILYLQQAITELPLGTTFLSLLNVSIDRKVLEKLTGLDSSIPVFDTSISLRERLLKLFESYNYTASFLEDFITIATGNDRLKASIYLAQRLNYSLQDTQNIASIVELWLVENSSI